MKHEAGESAVSTITTSNRMEMYLGLHGGRDGVVRALDGVAQLLRQRLLEVLDGAVQVTLL